MKEIKAFTLSEVLITLSILGVVAAITIPNVVSNYKTSILKTQLKQAYADLEQVSRIFAVLHGGMSIPRYNQSLGRPGFSPTCFNSFDEIIDKQYIKTKSTKEQNTASYISNTLKPQKIYMNLTNDKAVFPDLFAQGYFKDSKNRDWYGRCTAENNNVISIDINGYEKGPNRAGIDLFSFSIIPENSEISFNTYTQSWCIKSKDVVENQFNGIGCAEYAFKDVHPRNTSKTYWKDFLRSL